MSNRRSWLLLLILAMVSAAAWADRGQDDVFRCESKDREQSYCRLDVRGDVVLVKQLSRSSCTEGNTWGKDRRGVWVSGGCRGEFAVVARGGRDQDSAFGRARNLEEPRGYSRDRGLPDVNGPAGMPTVKCESQDRNYKHCNVRISGHVELSRQLSDKRCVYGQSWGKDGNGIWVNHGCRAEFVIYNRR